MTEKTRELRYYCYYCCSCLEVFGWTRKFLKSRSPYLWRVPVPVPQMGIDRDLFEVRCLSVFVFPCGMYFTLSKYDISHCSTNLPIQSFQYCFDSCAWLAIFEFPPNFYFPSNSGFELRTLSPWILYVSLLTFLSLPASTIVPSTSNLKIIFFSIQN